MFALTISDLVTPDDPIEVVKRKGPGHPDTICDALAETLSPNLCREYRKRFGHILHHNVDKALLCAGRSMPAYATSGPTLLTTLLPVCSISPLPEPPPRQAMTVRWVATTGPTASLRPVGR